ncbi:MAG: T9SS type A sorting domain-containing protein [Bacteroidales bacterium]|nr:T9SS type A sorting domain-containing protein [Bacteroidales bacterium]
MKTLVFFFLLLSFVSRGTLWIPYGPDTAVTYRVCFDVDNQMRDVICSDFGFYLSTLQQTWEWHETCYPVMDAEYLDGISILLLFNSGSAGDGIYEYNTQTGIYTNLSSCLMPNFISHDELLGKYFVGFDCGLLESDDGLNWTSVTTFNGLACLDMDCHNNHYVVTLGSSMYWSSDHGFTWNASLPGSPYISCLKFKNNGDLFGIFPDMSYSSGLWRSQDHGNTWTVGNYSVNMSSVGYDATGNIFVGWDANAVPPYYGVAMFDTLTGDFIFMNDDLPNKVIHSITHNPWMSFLCFFCCTDEGVYYTGDYIIGSQEQAVGGRATCRVYPNPCRDELWIEHRGELPGAFNIFDEQGSLISSTRIPPTRGVASTALMNLNGLSPGIYYYRLNRGTAVSAGKFIRIR